MGNRSVSGELMVPAATMVSSSTRHTDHRSTILFPTRERQSLRRLDEGGGAKHPNVRAEAVGRENGRWSDFSTTSSGAIGHEPTQWTKPERRPCTTREWTTYSE